jgi:hypothetical protein
VIRVQGALHQEIFSGPARIIPAKTLCNTRFRDLRR